MSSPSCRIVAHPDGDGVCGASLVKSRRAGAELAFAQPFALQKVLSAMAPPRSLFVLDVAADIGRPLRILRGLSAHGCDVVYVDHHSVPAGGINIGRSIHDSGRSTSELVFAMLGRPRGFELVTLIGATCDYLGDTALMRKTARGQDPVHVATEAALLSSAICDEAADDEFRRGVVGRLAQGEMPSEMGDLTIAAVRAMSQEPRVKRYAVRNAVRAGRLAHVEVPAGNTDTLAEHMLSLPGVAVAACYRGVGGGYSRVSARRSRDSDVDLFDTIRRAVRRAGGSCEGHASFARALAPSWGIPPFLGRLASAL